MQKIVDINENFEKLILHTPKAIQGGNAYIANISLNDSYVISMKSDVRDTGKTEYYYVLLHEVGHVLGIGTFWGHSGAPIVSYQEDGYNSNGKQDNLIYDYYNNDVRENFYD